MDSTSINLNLIHYSSQAGLRLNPISYLQRNLFKPIGLWFSVDTEWADWCSAESFQLGKLKYKYLVKLKQNANILYLSSRFDILMFTVQYNTVLDYSRDIKIHDIDWAKLSKKYDGIIISPYQRSCRLDPFWYCGWDCACGCIWNLNCLESLIPL